MSSTLGRFLASQGIRVNDNPAASRPGSFGQVRGVMWHHTAGGCTTRSTPGEVSNARNGGLYNLLVGADAVCYVLTRQAHGQPEPGRAHHAGTGGPWRNVPRDQGNAHIIGISGQCNGAHALATHPELYRVMLDTTVALCRRYNLTADQVLGHREWTARKIDPRDNMNTVRAAVRAALAPPPPPPPATTENEEEPMTLLIVRQANGSNVWWLQTGRQVTRIAAGELVEWGNLPSANMTVAVFDRMTRGWARAT